MAHEAGGLLRGFFGSPLHIEYKDEKKTDPVTVADTKAQELLTDAIRGRYPDHAIIGEEDEAPQDSIAPDFVWILDPLDGTKNFIQGLPLFVSSIGVLYRGMPVVGALYVPWPAAGGGVVMHARLGGGAYVDGERVPSLAGGPPQGTRLAGLPGLLGGFRVAPPMRDKVGEVRVTGSIAYELAMVARGVLQYSLFGGPHLWDVAGGAVIVAEAGGGVMTGRQVPGRMPLVAPRTRWEPLVSFSPSWRSGSTTLSELRKWSAPLVAGGPDVAPYVAANLTRRRRPLRRLIRR